MTKLISQFRPTAASDVKVFNPHRRAAAMAGKKRRAEPESPSVSEDEEGFDDDVSGDEAVNAGMDEEEEDDELEAEMAALEAIQREKRGAGGGNDKVRINNKPGLTASLQGTSDGHSLCTYFMHPISYRDTPTSPIHARHASIHPMGRF